MLICVWNQGRSQGGSRGARDPSFCKPFLTKQPTTGGENAMTIPWPYWQYGEYPHFDTEWPPLWKFLATPLFETSWLVSFWTSVWLILLFKGQEELIKRTEKLSKNHGVCKNAVIHVQYESCTVPVMGSEYPILFDHVLLFSLWVMR